MMSPEMRHTEVTEYTEICRVAAPLGMPYGIAPPKD